MSLIPHDFRGAARRIDDVDLPTLGARIGVGEDEIHAVLDVESRGYGFDKQGRPLILFEPHIFYRHLSGSKLDAAVRAGLAYPNWGEQRYPADSYPRLAQAIKIDETAALKSASWGLGQIMGANYKAAGYLSVQAMVAAFCQDEENHLSAMVNFIQSNGLDRALREHNWAAFARGYNGAAYAKNDYDNRLARRFAFWSKIADTPVKPTKWKAAEAAVETRSNDAAPYVVAPPPLRRKTPSAGDDGAAKQARPSIPPRPATTAAAPPKTAGGFWSRFIAAFRRQA